MVDDAAVGLVRHEHVDVGHGQIRHLEAALRGFHHHAGGELVDLRAVHLHVGALGLGLAVAGRRHRQQAGAASVRPHLEAAQAAAGRIATQHHRPGAVAEQDAGRAVAPVEQAREHLGSDHQHRLGKPGGDLRVALRQCVDEAGAGRREVVPGHVVGADPLADQRRSGREVVVGAGGRGHDQVELGRVDGGALDRQPCGLGAERCRGVAGCGDPPFADAGALRDPLVAGVDHGGDLVVGHHAVRHVRADAEQRDALAAGGDHWPGSVSAKVRAARQASSPSTDAVASA